MPALTSRTGSDSQASVSIRPANLADTSDIYAIECASFTQDGFKRRQFRDALKHGKNHFLIATIGTEAAGYIWVLTHKGRPQMGRIYSIAVSPLFQGKGIAAQLLAAAETQLHAQGCTELRLEVRADNTHAQQFYTHKGFSTFAHATDYYADGMTALKMKKTLN